MISEFNNDVGSKKVPIEVAIDKAGFGLYSWLLTCLTGLSIISSACVAYGTTILAPTSACDLNTTSAQQGLLVAAPILGVIIGAVIWGQMADLYGRRVTLLVSLCTAAIMNLASSLSVNWIMLMIMQFFGAMCASGQYSIAMALLSESVPLAKRNVVVLVVASIFLLSQGVMSVLAIPIIPLEFSYYISWLDIYWTPWRTLLIVYSVPSIICFIWLVFMQESPRYAFSKGQEERAIQILTVIHKTNNSRSLEKYEVKGLLAEKSAVSDGEKAGFSIMFKPPLLKYLIIMTILQIFLKVSAFMVWLPTILNYFVQLYQTGEGRDFTLCEIIRTSINYPVESDLPPCALDETSLLLILAVSCVQSLINICISLVINKTGRRNMVIAVAAICGVAGIIVNFIPNAITSLLMFVVFLTGLVLLGLYSAITIALFPTSVRAVAMAVTATLSRIMMVIIVQIVNFLLESDCELAFYIFASLIALSALIALLLPDDRLLKRPVEPRPADEPRWTDETKPEKRDEDMVTANEGDRPERYVQKF